ncbi:MAG TPA: hypothetical protein VF796_11280 [Humisphaera sp.]
MSGTSPSAPRSPARALVVGNPALRGSVVAALQAQSVTADEADDPYLAMAELCEHPRAYKAVVLSLQSLYREELAIIPSIKRAHRHVEIWLADIDGRSAALAEAMRLGADGLLGEDGLHRLGDSSAEPVTADAPAATAKHDVRHDGRAPADPVSSPVVRAAPLAAPAAGATDEPPAVVAAAPRRSVERTERLPAVERAREPDPPQDAHPPHGEPVLSADELRALLSDPGVG